MQHCATTQTFLGLIDRPSHITSSPSHPDAVTRQSSPRQDKNETLAKNKKRGRQKDREKKERSKLKNKNRNNIKQEQKNLEAKIRVGEPYNQVIRLQDASRLLKKKLVDIMEACS